MSVFRVPSALVAAAAFGLIALAAACNAIVGNGDIRIVGEDGGNDATMSTVGAMEASTTDGPVAEANDGAVDAGDAGLEAAALECEAGSKDCRTGKCVDDQDPVYGCGPNHCSGCELPGAFPGCALVDAGAGADAAVLACSVSSCVGTHADCNHNPSDGCEIDTSDDLYNCGACGHDCTTLPHVAGNVSCNAGVCTFDGSACAPGYGICSSDPNNGCDTVISSPGHCGGCSTACSSGFPYCSPTGNSADPFACTSGCAVGLSLCGASCVNEQSDPTHCGGCNTACPAITGGTPTCSSGGTCGFTCNASDHTCGTGNGASCAANNDPNNCGVGAACGKCTAPANATATCTGGTTCAYQCNPNAHPCGSACVLNTDPNNCGTKCGTNCGGPSQGSGVASCDGNVCAISCNTGQSLCGANQNLCVNEQTDSNHCGSCTNACSAGQTCSNGQCVCNATSCSNGCCDGNGACQTADQSACGSGGGKCLPNCPAEIPEAQNLVLWLVGDSYKGGTTWPDQSGHAAATCSSCPSVSAGAVKGHTAVSFDGTSSFALGDPGGLYVTSAFTIFVVAAPDPDAPMAVSNAQLIAFSDATGTNALGLQQSNGDPDLLLQLQGGGSLLAPGAWNSPPFEVIAAGIDASPNAFLAVGGSTLASGSIGAPAYVDYSASYLGTDPDTQMLNFTGQIAEVLVFNTTLSSASANSIQAYLLARYGL